MCLPALVGILGLLLLGRNMGRAFYDGTNMIGNDNNNVFGRLRPSSPRLGTENTK